MLAALLLLHIARVPITVSIEVDGLTRTALVYAPESGQSKPPIIFGFHGHGGSSLNAARSFDLHDAWPEAVVVYPQGLPTTSHYDPKGGRNGWAIDTSETNRDMRFFDALYAKVTRTYSANLSQVFAMGHSNGAQFMYTLWSMRSSKLAGIGSCEGTGGQSVHLTPKPFFMTIGDADPLVPPPLQHRSLDAVFQVNGSSTSGTPFGEKGVEYSGKSPVVLWSYHGGHRFPADCVPTMVRFFKSVR